MITGIGMIGTDETSIQIPTIPGSITVQYNPVEKKEYPYAQVAIGLILAGGALYFLISQVEQGNRIQEGFRRYRD
jgi:hypothetical protein